MLDGMRDRIAFVLICLVFIAICGRVALKFDAARVHDDFNCHYFCCNDDAYGTRKFKALKYYKA